MRYLGRKTPIDAKYDTYIVQTWLSNNEARRDLIARSSTFINMKAEFIISLSVNFKLVSSHVEKVTVAQNATSKYSHINLPFPSKDEQNAMSFLSSEQNKKEKT